MGEEDSPDFSVHKQFITNNIHKELEMKVFPGARLYCLTRFD